MRIVDAEVAGQVEWTLSASVPTRVVFDERIPRDAALSVSLAVDATGAHDESAGVLFRLGISDNRTYELLLDQSILARDTPRWVCAVVGAAAPATESGRLDVW